MGSRNEAKHRKSLPNRRQQGAPSAPPKGAALRAAPLGFVVCHLVRISYVSGAFSGALLGLHGPETRRTKNSGTGPVLRVPLSSGLFFSPDYCHSHPPDPGMLGKPRKVDSPKKKKVEKPQDGRQKSCQDIGNPYQMEDNKVAPSTSPPWGSCCLPFGKELLCFGNISGPRSGSIFD